MIFSRPGTIIWPLCFGVEGLPTASAPAARAASQMTL